MKYELVLDAGLSSCANDGAEHTLEACPVDSPARYTIVVVDQAWQTPRYTLVSHTTEAATTSIPTPVMGGSSTVAGGWSTGDVSDPAVQDAAQGALALLNGQSNSVNALQMVQLVSVKQQVSQPSMP